MKCGQCGQVNAAGATFCSGCRAFLDWDEAAPPAAQPPQAGPPWSPGPPPQSQPQQQRPPGPAGSAEPPPPWQPWAAEPTAAPVAPAVPTVPPRPAPHTVRRPDEKPDAPAPAPGPVEATGPVGTQAASTSAPPVRYCPSCGALNAVDRSLCIRCGVSLAAAMPVTPPRRRWWHRLAWWRRPARVYRAGERPARRMWRRPRLVIPVMVLALLGGGYYARPHLGRLVDTVRDRSAKPEEVNPTAVRASSATPGHPAKSAFDGFTNRYWSAAPGSHDRREFLEADFEEPVHLLKVIVYSGVSTKQDEFITRPRPKDVTITMYGADNVEKKHQTIHLRDEVGQQTFDVRGDEVLRVRLTVDSTFGGSRTAVSVTEVEFFRRR